MVSVRVTPGKETIGHLRFYEEENAFFFMPDPNAAFDQQASFNSGALNLGSLIIRVDVETGKALCVQGVAARFYWVMAHLNGPGAAPGSAFFVVEDPIFPEFFRSRIDSEGWNIFFDPQTEWIRVLHPDGLPDHQQVLVATGTVIGVRNGILNSIWLHPEFFVTDRLNPPPESAEELDQGERNPHAYRR